MEFHHLSSAELLALFRAGDASPVEVMRSYRERIRASRGLGAFVSLDLEEAETEALRAQERYRAGTARELEGLAFAAKDLIDTSGLPTTRGSAAFRSRIPGRDAKVVRRLREAGAILLGKTQTHEFGWGLTSVNRAMGSTRNPWDPERIAGGSSGGSAVAIATQSAAFALGTDTAGSTRVPASFCGTVGLKPTWGVLPTAGVMPLAPSLDHLGLLARTPADASLVFGAITGRVWAPRRGRPPRTVGVILGGSEVDEGIRLTVAATAARLEAAGAEVRELEPLADEEALDAFNVIQRAEALAAHRQLGIMPRFLESYGEDVRAHIEAASTVTVEDLARAIRSREGLRSRLRGALENVEAIVSPAVGVAAPQLGVDPIGLRGAILPFTVAQNLTGAPACVVRAGFFASGLPIGVQVTMRPGRDLALLDLTGWLFDDLASMQAPLPDERLWPPPGPGGEDG